METKQTAVEWLQEKIIISGFLIPQQFIEEAKQMEKEQIMDAYESGCIGEQFELNCNQSKEQYYNETYGKYNENNN